MKDKNENKYCSSQIRFLIKSILRTETITLSKRIYFEFVNTEQRFRLNSNRVFSLAIVIKKRFHLTFKEVLKVNSF